MIQYDLKFEIASFLVITIVMLNLLWDKELDSRRNKLFKGIVLVAFFSIVSSLVSTYTSDNFTTFPMWIIELAKVLYYCFLPSGAVVVYLYALSLQKTKNSAITFSAYHIIMLIPYVGYVCLVFSNYWLNNFFTISPEIGYVRGTLYQLPYPIAFFYIIEIFIIAIKNRRETNRGIGFILCVNMIIVTCISLIQFFHSTILLSGLANVTGVLVVYLFVQNVTKTTDQLTGLFNRDRLTFDLIKKIRLSEKLKKDETPFALIVYSIRNMKGINERLGLSSGNEIIESAGKYLRNAFNPHRVYRYSGDEFAILINDENDILEDSIRNIAKRFEYPFSIDENNEDVVINIVYARVDYPDFGKGARALVTAVDYSIASLKNGIQKVNYMHDISISTSMRRRNEIIEKLKNAVNNDEFEIYYQAIHSTEKHTFTNAEALLRLKNNHLDPVHPTEFIPLAEETGLIIEITYIVIEKVCADLRSMIDTYGDRINLDSVSINIPYSQFLESDMVNRIMSILKQFSISPSWIKIEITERTLIDDKGLIREIMSEMQSMGFVFELDDFGIDYSNMSMVLDLPVDIIKIDRSLVLTATATKTNETFFKLFIEAIKSTGRILIVEGAEEKEQAEFFENCGCEYIQGYYYAKPLEKKDFVTFLLENK